MLNRQLAFPRPGGLETLFGLFSSTDSGRYVAEYRFHFFFFFSTGVSAYSYGPHIWLFSYWNILGLFQFE